MKTCIRRWIALFGLSAFITPVVVAETTVAVTTVDETQQAPYWQRSAAWMAGSRDELSEHIETLGRRLDSFFSGQEVMVDKNKSYIRMRLGAIWKERYGVENDSDIKFRLDLPATKERYRIVIESESEEDHSLEESNRPALMDQSSPSRESVSAAVRFVSGVVKHWDTDLDIGVRTRIPLDPFIRGTAKREWDLDDNWVGRIHQRVSYFHSNSFSAKTKFIFERPLSQKSLFRHKTELEWEKLEDQLAFADVFSVFNEIDDDRVVEYQFGILGSSLSNTHIDDIFVGANYRERLYKDWLYLEVIPEILFPREDDYEMTHSLTLRLEVMFTKH